MNMITKENLNQVLRNGENEMTEFIRTIPAQFSAIERLISAFANTKGGSIIFGYDGHKREIVGIDYNQILYLRNKLETLEYKISYEIYPLEVDDKLLAILNVEKSRSNTYVKGVAYTRSGNKVFSKVGNIRSQHLKDFVEEIQYHNRNPRDLKALKLLDDVSTNPERILFPGTKLYRSRIVHDMSKMGKEHGFYGYGKKDSFVPPANVTRDLRANYRYIPYLYCANDPYTALVEVRPRLGANVSIATINVNEKVTLLDFTAKTIPKKMSNTKLNLFADLSMLFSKPVTSDDDILDYIPTQYIAEYAKHNDYDGIAFRSSLTPELENQDITTYDELDRYNVVIFNYQKCAAVTSNVVSVTRNYFEFEQVDKAPNSMNLASTLEDMYLRHI